MKAACPRLVCSCPSFPRKIIGKKEIVRNEGICRIYTKEAKGAKDNRK
jgi:hypothetical protein